MFSIKNKKVEDANARRVRRQLAKRLVPMGFTPRRSTLFTRQPNEHIVECIWVSKRSFIPEFRVEVALRVLNDSSDYTNASGFASDHYVIGGVTNQWYKEYNFCYHIADETIERCVTNLAAFVEEVAAPWFVKWRDIHALVNLPGLPPEPSSQADRRAWQEFHALLSSPGRPLWPPSQAALKRALAGDIDADAVRNSLKQLGLPHS